MAQERKGGLGRGLAALIPSAPAQMDTSGKTGAIGDAMATMGQRFVQIYGQGESPMTITS